MGFERQLFNSIKELYYTVKNKPFIAQYNRGEVTLNDHYQYLCQLQTIYCNMENMLNNPSFKHKIPVDLAELANRRECLSKDISFLEKRSKEPLKRAVLTDWANRYIDYLQRFKMEYDEASDALLAHYWVRMLNDMSDCQIAKVSVKNLYVCEGLIENDDSSEGVAFYEFSQDINERCSKWLDSLESGDKKLCEDENRMKHIISRAKEAFEYEIKILDDLELKSGRPNIAANKQLLTCNSFFAKPIVVAVAAAGATAVTIGMMW